MKRAKCPRCGKLRALYPLQLSWRKPGGLELYKTKVCGECGDKAVTRMAVILGGDQETIHCGEPESNRLPA